MFAEIWASVMSSFVDQLVALNSLGFDHREQEYGSRPMVPEHSQRVRTFTRPYKCCGDCCELIVRI